MNGTQKVEVQWCNGVAGMCFAINIPSADATDYYISMTAPSNVGWAAIGIGNTMPNSLMFVIAPQSNNNVSLAVKLTR